MYTDHVYTDHMDTVCKAVHKAVCKAGCIGAYHRLTKLMNLGENCLSSELLSWGGSPFTTCVS